jgi:hypothetical protein
MKMLFLTYTDMLRVAIVKGELNFPVLPAETRMPRREMEHALKDISRKLGGLDGQNSGSTTQGEGEVPELRGDTSSSNGAVRDRTNAAAVSGRGELRVLPALQEIGIGGGRSAERGSQETGGVERHPKGVEDE